jgi:tripartite-type tricarboxylate transporter receptor subunit TctC
MIHMRLGHVAAVAAAAVLGPVVAHSQDYPNRTVTIVAPAAPGGLYSLFARLVGLYSELRVIGSDRDMRNEFVRLSLVPVESLPPDELKRFVAAEIARWANVVRQAGLAGSE